MSELIICLSRQAEVSQGFVKSDQCWRRLVSYPYLRVLLALFGHVLFDMDRNMRSTGLCRWTVWGVNHASCGLTVTPDALDLFKLLNVFILSIVKTLNTGDRGKVSPSM